jgi:hypothetical protein
MKIASITLLHVAAFLVAAVTAPLLSAEPAQYVRWDIASVPCTGPGGSFPCTLEPHGAATAMATDCALNAGCSFITLTGSGTFLAAGNGQSSVVTGGGTWVVSASCTGIPFPPPGPPAPTCAGGTITKGTFVVTELLQWQKAEPLEVPECESTECETTDKIGNLRQATGGLAILRVAYSDGTTGVLTFACSGLVDPPQVAEGMTATKGVKLSNVAIPGINVPPLPANFKTSEVLVPVLFWYSGPDIYFVEFHAS